MNTNTPQQLGRTETALDDHGCDDSSFCLNCFKADLQLEDFRGELAFLAVVRMKNLVAIRVAEDGVSEQDAWSWILSGARCVEDTHSKDPARAHAAKLLSDVLGDYLVHRMILAHAEPRPLALSHKQMEIVERTHRRLDELQADGSEPDFFEPLN